MILARQFHRRPTQANCHRCTAHAATSGTTSVKLFNTSSNNARRRVKSELNFATAPRGNEKNGRTTTFIVSTKRRLTLSGTKQSRHRCPANFLYFSETRSIFLSLVLANFTKLRVRLARRSGNGKRAIPNAKFLRLADPRFSCSQMEN